MTSLVDGHLQTTLAHSPYWSTPEPAGVTAGQNQAEIQSLQPKSGIDGALQPAGFWCCSNRHRQGTSNIAAARRRPSSQPPPAVSYGLCLHEGSSPGLAAAAPVVLLCGCTLAGSGSA